MPTAVEYTPGNENELPAVQQPGANPGPTQDSHLPAVQQPGKNPGPVGAFTGGVFVMIIAVLLAGLLMFGPASLPGGLFHTLMGHAAWGSLSCLPAVQMGDGSVKPGGANDLPAVQMGDGSVKPGGEDSLPAVQMGDGSVKPGGEDSLPAVQMGDGSVKPGGEDSLPAVQMGDSSVKPGGEGNLPAVQMGDGSVKPGETEKGLGLIAGLALWTNNTRVGMGLDGFFVPPNPCNPPPAPMSGPAPGDEPVSTQAATEEPPAGEAAPACTPVPGDGVCSACENTDLDSDSCSCNMNGVCDQQEGFNCGDCMPTPSGGGNGGGNGGNSCACNCLVMSGTKCARWQNACTGAVGDRSVCR